MTNWRRAFSLAQFELRIAAPHFLLIFFMSLLMALFLGTTIFSDTEGVTQSPLFDFMFLILFSIFPVWMKPKASQYQKVDGELWASHIFIMQKQLPIPEDILIKSRFIIHALFSLPMQLFILLIMYPVLFSTHLIMSPFEYVAFSIIWLSFSVYAGFIMAVSDAGDRVNVKTMTIAVVQLAIFFTVLLVIFHIGFGVGIVYWTVSAVKSSPILSSLVSILLALISIKYWQSFMKRIIKRMDYF